jgi:hypothetical protein
LACDLKGAQTNHVRSKLSKILQVYLENMFPEYYTGNQNIGSNYQYFKLIIQLTISIIDYRTALEKID